MWDFPFWKLMANPIRYQFKEQEFLQLNFLGILFFQGSTCQVTIYTAVIPVPVSQSPSYMGVKQSFADDFHGNMESFVRAGAVPQNGSGQFVNHPFE